MDVIHAQQGRIPSCYSECHAHRRERCVRIQRLDECDRRKQLKNTVNLDQVEFIDSSGLGAVVSVMKHLGKGRKMDLCALTPTVEKVFRLTRMDSIFSIYATLEQVVSDQKATG